MTALRILLVAPDGPHRRGLRRALSRDGHTVRCVTVAEAEEDFAEFGPDVVLALSLATGDEREPSIPSGWLAEALRAGAVRYLACAPPVNMEELRQGLRE